VLTVTICDYFVIDINCLNRKDGGYSFSINSIMELQTERDSHLRRKII